MNNECNTLKEFVEDSINNYGCFNIEIKPIKNRYEQDIPHKAFLVSVNDAPNTNIMFSKELYVLAEDIFYIEAEDIKEVDSHIIWLWIVEDAIQNAVKKNQETIGNQDIYIQQLEAIIERLEARLAKGE
jgi:hypothetical protein